MPNQPLIDAAGSEVIVRILLPATCGEPDDDDTDQIQDDD